MIGKGYYQLDALAYAYIDMLKENQQEYIEAVEDMYTGDQALALPIVLDREWHKGSIPEESIMVFIQDFPAVTVEAVSVTPDPNPTISGLASVGLQVNVYTSSEDPFMADSMNSRIASAIASIMVDMQPRGVGIKNVGAVSLATSETVLALDEAQGPFIKFAIIQTALTVGARV